MKRKLLFWLMGVLCGVAAGAQEPVKLTGTPIGSTSYDYTLSAASETVNTPACAFDGDKSTFYASYERSRTWVGLDLGTPHVITQVGWCPRGNANGLKRTQLGVFEGANSPDFLDAVPLYLVPNKGTMNLLEYAPVQVSRGFRYVRWVGPNDARCNIAEVEFYGYEGEGSDSVFYQITNLPTVSIHTYAGTDPADKVTEMESNIALIYDGGTRIQEHTMTIRGRGNNSWTYPKKPYRFKFTDGKHHIFNGSELESPAKAKKWTLINNYGDKTLMRNILAFEVSRRLKVAYTPYCQPVDVLLNGEYKGCYQLCDQITVGKDRVDIAEMDSDDIAGDSLTGGYLLEMDAYASQEASWFKSGKGIPITIKSPQDDEIVPEQSAYIKGYFNLLEDSLWAADYQQGGYRRLLDVESFLRHFLVGEFSGNTDTYWSTYLYKDRLEDQFHVGPVWDFDLAFENDNRTYPICDHTDWIYNSGGSCASGVKNFVNRILADPVTLQQLRDIWQEARSSRSLDTEVLQAIVDSVAERLQQSQVLEFTRWPIMNSKIHANPVIWGSYEAEVQNVRDYIARRMDWIDDYMEQLVVDTVGIGYACLSGDAYGDGKESCQRLLDGLTTTKWGNTLTEPQHVIFRTSEAILPSEYYLVTGNDCATSKHRNWKTWRIYGANFAADSLAVRDAEEWTLLDEKVDMTEDILPDKNYYKVRFDMSEPLGDTFYSYFKIEVDSTMAGVGSFMQMAEFAFVNPLTRSSWQELEDGVQMAQTAPERVDVYSLAGWPVRRGVTAAQALKGLPAGVYIVGNKKMVVR